MARWVNYSIVNREGKKTKIPFSPITRKLASSTNNEDWGTYAQALKVNKDNVGIVFDEQKLLLGIDIDHCLNDTGKIEHENKHQIEQIILESDSYTEISPSGKGLHIYLELEQQLTLAANRHACFEAYTNGRYFTTTFNSYGETKEIRKIQTDEALALLSILGYPWGKTDTQSEVVKTVQNEDKEKQLPNNTADNTQLLEKAFFSKGGAKLKALYNGDISAHDNDASKADMAFLSHLAFWTQKNAQAIESIWLNSPLGQREKTQTRKDYRDRSISAAISHTKEVYEPSVNKKVIDENPDLDLIYHTIKGDKIYIQNTENICRILRKHPNFKDILRYDVFKNVTEIKRKGAYRELNDNDKIDIQTEISVLFPMFAKVGKEMVNDAMGKVSIENQIDSAIDWVTSLQWDQTPRLDDWLSSAFNTPNDIYYKAVGSNWLKGLVKRLVEPGCKFDHVLVLEGEQGIGKSTALAILGEAPIKGQSWHVETTMSTDNKDFFMQFQGKAIIEFSEGETLNRTEVKRMKAIITMQADRFRMPFGKVTMDFPRRCVFAMTTNQDEYLKDETGNRRWLPVACVGKVNLQWLRENKDQLYAEAYHRITVLQETCYEFPEEAMRDVQNSRRIHDANEDLIADWYFNKLKDGDRDQGITVHQVYRDALHGGMASKPLDKSNEMAIGGVLAKGLNLLKKRSRIDGVLGTRWFLQETSIQGALEMPLTEVEQGYKQF